jgi:hypothetical protein
MAVDKRRYRRGQRMPGKIKCFVTLVTGFVGEGTTFIHDLKAELLLTSALIDRKAVIIAMAIDDRDIENDFLIDQLRH